MDDNELEGIEERIGYRFRNRSLLERALTHRSFANENRLEAGGDYERLEFLGDALIGFLVSEALFRSDAMAPEGVLTRRKQQVVQTPSLAGASADLGLGSAMRLSRGEEATGGREKGSLLADVFEAVVAAVYLDGGIRASRTFCRRHLAETLRSAGGGERAEDDYKTRLQERLQSTARVTPRYRIVAAEGPDHAREFRAEVRIGGTVLGSGTGTSRKRAEQSAARMALRQIPEEGRQDDQELP